MSDEFNGKIAELTARAAAHGVELAAGETAVSVVEKLIKRLDAYRDKPYDKGRIPIE